MKKFLNFFMLLSLIAGWSSCSDNDDPVVKTDNEVDATQQTILKDYVSKVVVPTYRSLASAAAQLAEDCEDLTTQAAVNKACADWVEARFHMVVGQIHCTAASIWLRSIPIWLS